MRSRLILISIVLVAVGSLSIYQLYEHADSSNAAHVTAIRQPELLSVTRETSSDAVIIDENSGLGLKRRASYRLTNRQSRPVSIVTVKKSCGCVDLMIDGTPYDKAHPPELQPDSSCLLQFATNVSRREEVQHKMAVQLTVKSDDDQSQDIRLEDIYHVYQQVNITPQRLLIDFADPLSAEKFTMRVDRVFSKDVNTDAVECIIRNLPEQVELVDIQRVAPEVELLHSSEWQLTSWTLRMSAKPNFPDNTITQFSNITIDLVENEQPLSTIEAPLTLRRQYGLQFPETVHLGVVEVLKTKEQTFTVTSASSAPFKVIDASTDPEATFSITHVDGELEKPSHEITVRFHPLTPGSQTGSCLITTDNPETDKVKVNFSGYSVSENP